MDRRIILAVAGAGKTTYLINSLNIEKRFLIVTYTNNNLHHLRKCVINKFGYLPTNIKLLTYYQFLLRICFKPFFQERTKAKGITWRSPEEKTLRMKRNKIAYYMSKSGYIYSNRLAKLCQYKSENIRNRIEKYYDCFMFDEVQDLGGHDFDLIKLILPQNKDCILVGDFYQHTFETSNDGNLHKGLYKNLRRYIKEWKETKIKIDTETLRNSYRCTETVCNYVSENLGVNINSANDMKSDIYVIDNQTEADDIYFNNNIVKLFYQEKHKYKCYSENWGLSKGIDDFNDVCIILNKTTLKAFKSNKLIELAPSTRNKLYVACTRAKGNIYFMPHTFIDKYKQK